MTFGWIFVATGGFALMVFLGVWLGIRSLREEMAAEIGTPWQRIAEGAILAAGLSMTGSQVSLAIAFFSQTTVTNPLGATVLGIPFANLSTYFLQVTIPSMGVGILAVIVGKIVNYR